LVSTSDGNYERDIGDESSQSEGVSVVFILPVGGRALRGDGLDDRCPAVHSADNTQRPVEYRGDTAGTGWSGGGRLEVRALETVLSPTQPTGRQITDGMLAADVHSDDGHRAVDLLMRRP